MTMIDNDDNNDDDDNGLQMNLTWKSKLKFYFFCIYSFSVPKLLKRF